MITEKQFRGLDLSAEGDSIGPGFLVKADNAIIDGTDVVSRPGRRGQLSSAMGAAVYGLTPFIASGSSQSIFVSGGKLYKWTKNANSATEVLAGASSLTLTSADVMTAASVGIAYLVDGASAMYRTDMTDANTSAMTILSKPTKITSVSLVGDTIDDGNTYSNWAGMDTATSAECLLNTSFESFTGTVASPDNWTEYVTGHGWSLGDAAATGNTPSAGTYVCWLQVGDGGRYQRFTPETLTNPDGTMKKVRHFTLSFKAHSRDASQLSTVLIKVSALDASNNDMSVRTFNSLPTRLSGTSATDYIQFSYDVTFTDLETDPTSIEVGIFPGLENQDTVLIDEISLKDAAVGLVTLDGAATGFDAYISATTTGTSGRSVVIQESTTLAGASNGLFIMRDFGSDQDFSKYSRMKAVINIAPAVKAANPNLTLRLGFRKSSGGVYWSPNGFYVDGDNPSAMVFEVGDIDPTTLAATRYMLIQVVGDQMGGAGSSSIFFSFEGLFGVGNLNPESLYWYKFYEFNSNSDTTLFNVLESDVSEASVTIVPTISEGMAKIVLPARTNSTADYWVLVRYGGTLIDPDRGKIPLGFILAAGTWAASTFAMGADAGVGSGTYFAFPKNPYVSWTKTGATGAAGSYIIDSTPDGWLAQRNIVREGKEAAPTAAVDVCIWKDRVWLAKTNEVWGSWRLIGDKPVGLYFSRVVLPSDIDPTAQEKGYYAKLPLETGDSIKRVIPYGEMLVVLTSMGLWTIKGDGPLTFYPTRHDGDRFIGLIAKRAAIVYGGLLWFLSSDGLYTFDGKKIDYVGKPLRRALYPQGLPNGTALTASVLATASLAAAGKFLVLTVPDTNSSTYPDVAYVLSVDDKKINGWTKWTGHAMTGGAGFVSALDTADLVFSGRDGQLYQMTGSGDKSTPVASTTAVGFEIETRTYGTKAFNMIPGRIFWETQVETAGNATLSVKGAVSGADWSLTQALVSGENTWWTRVSRSPRGRGIRANFAMSSTGQVRVQQMMLEMTETYVQGYN